MKRLPIYSQEGTNPMDVLDSILNGKTVEKAYPVFGPRSTLRGLTVVFTDGTTVSIKSNIVNAILSPEELLHHEGPAPQYPVLSINQEK